MTDSAGQEDEMVEVFWVGSFGFHAIHCSLDCVGLRKTSVPAKGHVMSLDRVKWHPNLCKKCAVPLLREPRPAAKRPAAAEKSSEQVAKRQRAF